MKKHKKRCFLNVAVFLISFFLPAVALAAQSTSDVTVDPADKEELRRQIIGQNNSQPVDEEYVVGYRDILHVSVYGEGSMSVAGGIEAEPPSTMAEGGAAVDFIRGRGAGIEVRLDGRISLRHIGDVAVVGMTLTEIANYLKQLYSSVYNDPDVTVTLVQSNSLQYTVMGQVISPGLYHLDFPLTVVRAVARAGGFTEWANSNITVIRPDKASLKAGSAKTSKGESFKFDFDDFLKGRNLESNILIKSGDVIVVH